jgi:hypothetical protein
MEPKYSTSKKKRIQEQLVTWDHGELKRECENRQCHRKPNTNGMSREEVVGVW